MAIVETSKYPLDSTTKLNTDFLDMHQKSMFFKSALYQDFLGVRFDQMILNAKQVKHMDAQSRRELVESLLGQCPTSKTEHRETLEFAKTIFGPALEVDKVKYLLQGDSFFMKLIEWSPSDSRLCLRPFVGKDAVFSEISWASFSAGAKLILEHDGIIEGLEHPTVKGILRIYRRMLDVAEEFAGIQGLVDVLFAELCESKLGIEGVVFGDVPELSGADMLSKAHQLHKILGQALGKLHSAAYPAATGLIDFINKERTKTGGPANNSCRL
jgi:hypothetical protein